MVTVEATEAFRRVVDVDLFVVACCPATGHDCDRKMGSGGGNGQQRECTRAEAGEVVASESTKVPRCAT